MHVLQIKKTWSQKWKIKDDQIGYAAKISLHV